MRDENNGVKISINSGDEGSDSGGEEGENIVDIDDDFSHSTTIVGTVHVSPNSKETVENLVSKKQPDVVGIELDRERLYDMLERDSDVLGRDNNDVEFSLGRVIREQQEKQIEGTGMLKPGEADMLPAVSEAVDLNLDVGLIDMSKQSLKENVVDKSYDGEGNLDLTILNKIKRGEFSDIYDSVSSLVFSRQEILGNLDSEDADISDIVEAMENSSQSEVASQFEPLREIAPEFVESLIDERDKNMAGHIHWLRQNGYSSVCVMGLGHISGVKSYLQNPSDIPEDCVQEPEWYEYQKLELS